MLLFRNPNMRISLIMLVTLVLAACGRTEISEVTLEVGKAARVNGCNVFLHHALQGDPFVTDVTWVCDAPESALKEKNWWGEGVQPPASSMFVGDCLRLNKKIYCMETIEPGKSATLKSTYEEQNWNGELLRRVR